MWFMNVTSLKKNQKRLFSTDWLMSFELGLKVLQYDIPLDQF